MPFPIKKSCNPPLDAIAWVDGQLSSPGNCDAIPTPKQVWLPIENASEQDHPGWESTRSMFDAARFPV
jgi:hypothetical protein